MIILLTITILHISALILPGPDFFVTLNNSIRYGRLAGIITSLGIATGIAINSLIAYWFGNLLLYKHPILFKLLVMLGIIYLVYLSCILFSGSKNSNSQANRVSQDTNSICISKVRLYLNGCFTNLANIKAIVFFCSVLSLVKQLDHLMILVVWFNLITITAIWFIIVSIVFSITKFRIIFNTHIRKVEILSGAIIMAFAMLLNLHIIMQ